MGLATMSFPHLPRVFEAPMIAMDRGEKRGLNWSKAFVPKVLPPASFLSYASGPALARPAALAVAYEGIQIVSIPPWHAGFKPHCPPQFQKGSQET
jgi:hypothetical protein